MNGRRQVGEIVEAVARLSYRHQGIGDGALLTADRIQGPAGEPWWSVSLDCGPGSPPARAGLRSTVWCATPAMARRAFAERQRALRAAGYQRVE